MCDIDKFVGTIVQSVPQSIILRGVPILNKKVWNPAFDP